jgi:hypothetical protein
MKFKKRLEQAGIVLSPLSWENISEKEWVASSPFKDEHYEVDVCLSSSGEMYNYGFGKYHYVCPQMDQCEETAGYYYSLEEAQNACQEDYEKLIEKAFQKI